MKINNSVEQESKLSYAKILLYCSVFFAIWSLYAFSYHTVIKGNLGDWGIQIIDALIKLSVWTLPAVLLVRHYKNDMLLTLREMFTMKVKLLPHIIVFFGFLVFNLVSSIILHGSITIIRPDPVASLLGTVLLVGITEELVFRAFLLNALLKKAKGLYAHTISSLLFMGIHIPGWAFGGVLSEPLAALSACVSVFALSLVFGWTFSKSRSIIIPVCLHMSWNLMGILLVG